MKNFHFALFISLAFTLLSCSDSSTGPNPGNSKNGSTPTHNVSVNISPSNAGTISPSADSTYDGGAEISLKANPTEGYKFTYWDGDIDSTDENPLSLTVDQNYSLRAHFDKKSYELTVDTEGQGSVDENVVQQKSKEYDHGTVVELTANPADSWKFVKWKGDLTGTDNPTKITVDSPKSVTAVFEKKDYPLTVNTDGEGAVDEQIIKQKTTDYKFGTEVKLTANPAKGWKFVKWTGDLTGSDNPAQITVDTTKEVTAIFEKKSYALNITTEGEGAVAKDPDQTEYKFNSSVSLTAQPATGYKFVKWQGDISGTTNPSSVTMDTSKTVTAVFEKKTFTLSVETSGEGSVTATPAQQEYEYGTEVELLAEPNNSNWEFESWDGDTTSTDNPITISVDSSITVTGKFANSLFAGGAGTEENPYKISTINQLQAINQYLNAHYVQINDIDASETESWNGGNGFEPIGDDLLKFTGTYNGDNYSINELRINRPEQNYIGLFGYTSESVIDNLELNNAEIYGNENVGTLIANNKGEVKNITISGNVSGSIIVGGIVGLNDDMIKNSRSSININADKRLGGIAGRNNGVIEGSIASGNIEGNIRVGGIAGRNDGEIRSTNSEIDIVSNNQQAGGIVGSNLGLIVDTEYNGSIEGILMTGGITGRTAGGGEIRNSTASATIVASDSQTGGITGKLSGTIINSNSNSNITGKTSVGGIAGQVGDQYRTGSIEDSYSNGEINGTIEVGGAIGLMFGGGTIDNIEAKGTVNGKSFVGGLIGNLIGTTVQNSNSEVDVSAEDKYVGGLIGITQVSASFLGPNSKVINSSATGNVSSNGNLVGGLVGSNTASIEDSYATGNVSGNDNIGGLIGGGNGVVISSYSTGNISGNNSVGGFAGTYSSLIKKSYASGEVTSEGYEVGGFIGKQNGNDIISSFANGTVSGNEKVGGFTGLNIGGMIKNSYSKSNTQGDIEVGGLVGINRDEAQVISSYSTGTTNGTNDVGGLIGINGATVESSYWDTESSNQSNAVGRGSSDGTTGLTTSQMTGTSAKDNMPDFNWTDIWITTDNYPALFWE